MAEPNRGGWLSDEGGRGLTALFWSNVNPYGTSRLEMDERLDTSSPRTSTSEHCAVSVPGGSQRPEHSRRQSGSGFTW